MCAVQDKEHGREVVDDAKQLRDLSGIAMLIENLMHKLEKVD